MYYQVSYDLNKEKNYEKLYDGLKGYGTYCKILLSTWVIKTNQSAQQVFETLRPLIDDNDNIFISQVNSNFMARASKNTIDWVNGEHIS